VVEVKGGGLKAGDRLVLSPAPDLKAGQTVRIAALAK
jgi:hypothetical protein